MEINLNQAIFTTKFVLDDNSPIVYVSHDEDGDWQFFGEEEEVDAADARVISLGAMIEIEPSVKDILWIPEGTQAWRDLESKEWNTSASK